MSTTQPIPLETNYVLSFNKKNLFTKLIINAYVNVYTSARIVG